jgi:hypothetical protein
MKYVMVFSDTRGVMVDTGRKIDQGFADATLPNDKYFGVAANLEFFPYPFRLTLFHPVLESIFPWHTWDFSFSYLDGRFHWTGM